MFNFVAVQAPQATLHKVGKQLLQSFKLSANSHGQMADTDVGMDLQQTADWLQARMSASAQEGN